MRLLIECTFVYNHPHINSGIQRVVRNIARELTQNHYDFPCIPIVYKRGTTYEIVDIKPSRLQLRLAGIWQFFQTPRHQYWSRHADIERHRPFRSSRNWRRALYVIARLFDLFLLLPLAGVRLLQTLLIDRVQLRKFVVDSNDTLLLLDSSWHATNFHITENLKKKSLRIIGVIYDVIPITHPQFFETSLVNTFQRWFKWITQIADGLLTISQDVTHQSQQILATLRAAADPPDTKTLRAHWFDHFYLGSELDLVDKNAQPSPDVVSIFKTNDAVYLAVGTIEPRKNQSYLLDVFDLLWEKNLPVKLMIVGRIGWKCESFVQRVRNHVEFGKRLFMFNNASDTDLNYCYSHAKALLCPSVAEGFGLPVVEAMQRGIPVMASDIAVFREVGRDFIAYFDLDKSSSLADFVKTFEISGQFPAKNKIQNWRWIDWREAANMLVAKIVLHAQTESTCSNLAENTVSRAHHS
jgi:alpha-1,2-rhamnosyltransferase